MSIYCAVRSSSCGVLCNSRAFLLFFRQLSWKQPCCNILMSNISEFQQKQYCDFACVPIYTYTLTRSLTDWSGNGFNMTLLFEPSFSDGFSKAFDQAKLCGSMLDPCTESYLVTERLHHRSWMAQLPWFLGWHSGEALLFTNIKGVARMEIDPAV